MWNETGEPGPCLPAMTPTEYLRVVVDRDRLALLGRAALGPFSVSEFAGSVGGNRKKLLLAAAKLREAGLLNDDHSLNDAVFDALGEQLPDEERAAPEILEGDWSEDEIKVLNTFFQGTRLTAIPTNYTKRHVILERIVQTFEPGVRYPERQVSFMLQLYFSDYAALRRYMVDDELLARADGVYWRIGGRYPGVARST